MHTKTIPLPTKHCKDQDTVPKTLHIVNKWRQRCALQVYSALHSIWRAQHVRLLDAPHWKVKLAQNWHYWRSSVVIFLNFPVLQRQYTILSL